MGSIHTILKRGLTAGCRAGVNENASALHSTLRGEADTNAFRFVWQLPQNLLGLALSTAVRTATVERFESAGRIVFRCFRSYGGVSLGSYVFVHIDAGDDLIRHELGHCRQSMLLGPLYLLAIGLPSIVWAAVHGLLVRRNPGLDYFRFYTERWADRIAGLVPPRSPGGRRARRGVGKRPKPSSRDDPPGGSLIS